MPDIGLNFLALTIDLRSLRPKILPIMDASLFMHMISFHPDPSIGRTTPPTPLFPALTYDMITSIHLLTPPSATNTNHRIWIEPFLGARIGRGEMCFVLCAGHAQVRWGATIETWTVFTTMTLEEGTRSYRLPRKLAKAEESYFGQQWKEGVLYRHWRQSVLIYKQD